MDEQLAPRRAGKGDTFGYTDSEGNQVELKADGNGLVRPRNAQDAAVLDNYELPHARVTTSSSKAKAPAKAAKSEPVQLEDGTTGAGPDLDGTTDQEA